MWLLPGLTGNARRREVAQEVVSGEVDPDEAFVLSTCVRKSSKYDLKSLKDYDERLRKFKAYLPGEAWVRMWQTAVEVRERLLSRYQRVVVLTRRNQGV